MQKSKQARSEKKVARQAHRQRSMRSKQRRRETSRQAGSAARERETRRQTGAMKLEQSGRQTGERAGRKCKKDRSGAQSKEAFTHASSHSRLSSAKSGEPEKCGSASRSGVCWAVD